MMRSYTLSQHVPTKGWFAIRVTLSKDIRQDRQGLALSGRHASSLVHDPPYLLVIHSYSIHIHTHAYLICTCVHVYIHVRTPTHIYKPRLSL